MTPPNQPQANKMKVYTNKFSNIIKYLIKQIQIFCIENLIKPARLILELLLILVLIFVSFIFPSFVWGYIAGTIEGWISTVVASVILFGFPLIGMSLHMNAKEEHHIQKYRNWRGLLIIFLGYMALTFAFPIVSGILTQAFGENPLEYLQKTFKDLNQESALIFSFVCISLTLLVILIKRHWFVTTSLIGIFIASFILLAPSILKGIERFGQLIEEQGLGIFLIVVVSGIVLPFMVYSALNSKESPIKSNTPPNFDIIKFAAIRALIVPGLIFSFINSADINLGIPDKHQEANQITINITSEPPQE